MVPAVNGICHMDSQDLARPIFYPLIATSSIFCITDVAEVVLKLILRSKPLHVLTVHGKVLQFTLFNKPRPIFFFQIFVLMEGVVLVPPNLHKLTFVAPASMRDDLHSYLLPLLL
jgi:hypothetical protein